MCTEGDELVWSTAVSTGRWKGAHSPGVTASPRKPRYRETGELVPAPLPFDPVYPNIIISSTSTLLMSYSAHSFLFLTESWKSPCILYLTAYLSPHKPRSSAQTSCVTRRLPSRLRRRGRAKPRTLVLRFLRAGKTKGPAGDNARKTAGLGQKSKMH